MLSLRELNFIPVWQSVHKSWAREPHMSVNGFKTYWLSVAARFLQALLFVPSRSERASWRKHVRCQRHSPRFSDSVRPQTISVMPSATEASHDERDGRPAGVCSNRGRQVASPCSLCLGIQMGMWAGREKSGRACAPHEPCSQLEQGLLCNLGTSYLATMVFVPCRSGTGRRNGGAE